MKGLFLIIILSYLSNSVSACDIQNSSTVYFKMFNTETFLPLRRKEFKGERRGYKLQINNEIFRKILIEAEQNNLPNRFIEDIRMKVFYKGQIYFISRQGEIELNSKLIGVINIATRKQLDYGLGLYEQKTCRPFSEVLKEDILRIENQRGAH